MRDDLRLPTDLYRPIALNLSDADDWKTLASLIRVSRAVHEEAIPALYHTISLASMTIEAQKEHLRTLVSTPRYAKHVRTFTFSATERPSGYILQEGDEYWALLAAAFRVMNGVTTLGFPGTLPPFAPPLLLPHCSMPNLYLFMWNAPCGDDDLITFFERHPSIRQMSLSWEANSHKLLESPHILPRLNYVCGSTSTFNALLPHRKIPKIEWISGSMSPLDTMPSPALLTSLSNVRVLTLSPFGPPWGVSFSIIAPYLGGLEILYIGDYLDVDMILKDVPPLPRLRCLMFSTSSGEPSRIERIFWAANRTLEAIYVQWHAEEPCSRYIPSWVDRNGETELVVSREVMGEDWEFDDIEIDEG